MNSSSISWTDAAAAAESSLVRRQLRTLLPGAALGMVGWPATVSDRSFARWHYWWQAHLLDCLVDAQMREPNPGRLRQIRAVARGIRLRNGFRWVNDYFDDIAWLGLALHRATELGFLSHGRAVAAIENRLRAGWNPTRGGGIAWNRAGDYFNAPANGPAGIFFARVGDFDFAGQIADWIDLRLSDPVTGLVFDGVGADSAAILNTDIYTYCQGVVLGLETEMVFGGSSRELHRGRISRLLTAIERELTVDGVLIGHGGGNGGLFSGITVRYLAVLAKRLSAVDPVSAQCARSLVLQSASAVWRGRREVDGGLLFAADWSQAAGPAGRAGSGRRRADGADSSVQPERDLSVQLGAWMALEAAATLTP